MYTALAIVIMAALAAFAVGVVFGIIVGIFTLEDD